MLKWTSAQKGPSFYKRAKVPIHRIPVELKEICLMLYGTFMDVLLLWYDCSHCTVLQWIPLNRDRFLQLKKVLIKRKSPLSEIIYLVLCNK